MLIQIQEYILLSKKEATNGMVKSHGNTGEVNPPEYTMTKNIPPPQILRCMLLMVLNFVLVL